MYAIVFFACLFFFINNRQWSAVEWDSTLLLVMPAPGGRRGTSLATNDPPSRKE